MSSWTVNGQNQLNQQWFWYRIGNSGVAQPINQISSAAIVTGTGSDGINEVQSTYANSQLTLVIDYQLTGGGVGSGNTDITGPFRPSTRPAAALDFHFFPVSNFNLLEATMPRRRHTVQGRQQRLRLCPSVDRNDRNGEAVLDSCANRGESCLQDGTTLNGLRTR